MRFSDYITNADLYVYPTIGLIAFILVFAVVAWRAFRTSKAELEYQASMPLESSEQVSSNSTSVDAEASDERA